MDKREFFDDIYSNCNNDDEKVIELLLTRGFLIDFVQDKHRCTRGTNEIK